MNFLQDDAVEVAQKLLGCTLYTRFDGMITGGRIIETEAYRGPEDRACHAHNGRRTQRTATMFGAGGVAYVYLCYGIHHLLNVVTGKEEEPQAVLIRALEPLVGLDVMRSRRGKGKLCAGPGTLTQALGIRVAHNGLSLSGETIWLEEGSPLAATAGPRIGVDYAGEWAKMPWRFVAKGEY